MINIDTFRIAIPNELIKDFDGSKYRLTSETDQATGEMFGNVFKLKRNHRGLAFATKQQTNFIVHGSSKILGYDCRELLNKTNFHKALKIIAEKTGTKYNIAKVMKESSFCILHATKHISVNSEQEVDQYISAMSFLSNNRYYDHKGYINQSKYDGYKGSGAQFIRSVKTKQRKERLILYNKLAEISGNDIGAYKFLSDQGSLDDVGRTIRVECNLNSHYKFKQRCGAKNALVNSVLNAEGDPVAAIFSDIVKHAQISESSKYSKLGSLSLPNVSTLKMQGIKPKDIEWYYGARAIIETYQGNEKTIKAHYQDLGCSSSVTSKKMKKLRPLIREVAKEKMRAELQGVSVTDKIKYIEEKIRATQNI